MCTHKRVLKLVASERLNQHCINTFNISFIFIN